MLCLSVNERRKIPARSITKTFASGKTEKMIWLQLSELKICSGKVKKKTIVFDLIQIYLFYFILF